MLIKCIDTNVDPHITSLQIRSAPVGKGLLSAVTLLFTCPMKSIMTIFNRPSVNTDNDDKHYETLVERQVKADKNCDTLRNSNSLPIESIVEK